MKICHVTSMHDWDDDRIYQRACRRLSLMGHDVTLVATGRTGEPEDGVALVRLKARTGLRRRVLTSLEAFRKALGVQADILHFHDPDLLPFLTVARLLGRRVVYDVHENYLARFYGIHPARGLRWLVGRGFCLFETTCVRLFDGVVTVTPSMGEKFRGKAQRLVDVSNVPDLGRLEGLDPSTEKFPRPTVYTTGYHSEARHCRQTVEALPSIARRVPEVEVMFAGRFVPEGYEKVLRRVADDLGVSEHLRMEPLLAWRNSFDRTARAHVGCVFLEPNPNYSVTHPNRLFEYMVCGVPVIAEDFPEMRRVVEDAKCGLLVDSCQPEAIVEAAVYLLTHTREAREMGLRGRRAVLERFNYEAEARKLEELYRSILLRVDGASHTKEGS